jgi:isoamylase
MQLRTTAGRPYPLGATVTNEGINFALFSRHATRVYLEFFTDEREVKPQATFVLNSELHRTGDVWHLFVHGAPADQLYGYRVDGPYTPQENGHRFNVHKLLADPYARALIGRCNTERDTVYGYERRSPLQDLSFSTTDSAPDTFKSVALAPSLFDWEQDRRPNTPLQDSVIYETHVKGFTMHPSSAVAHPGTFAGLAEKIPHLLDLGVTAVELLPVHEFNEHELSGLDPLTKAPLHNFWGYATLGFFAPEQSFAKNRHGTNHVREFQQLVRALHQAGIELILDVVFNHTGEGDERGPTLSFRGLANTVYYTLDNFRGYKNYSGCGNTVNCNHPVVKQFILDCLRYWVVEMHVDGFRFDLATILGRTSSGEWIGDLGLLYDIGGDPILRGCKLIAEAWDADGMYKVGGFPRNWAEWNGRFRDDLRCLIRGDQGLVPQLARRLGGSRDLFARKSNPAHSINFLTAHDGFTLRDLVSYNQKHNERNGEENQDGSTENCSFNWGVEGETSDQLIRQLRRQQAKNLLTLLLVSRGTPMLLGGDELWRTQQGNNNTYCQDNELSWFDWTPTVESAEMLRFTRLLVALRRRHPALRRPCFADPFAVDGAGVSGPAGSDITWHGVQLHLPDWAYHSRTLALSIHGDPPTNASETADHDFYLVINAWQEALAFGLPVLPPTLRWHRLIDTSLPSPNEILLEEQAPVLTTDSYRVLGRSVVLLLAKGPGQNNLVNYGH